MNIDMNSANNIVIDGREFKGNNVSIINGKVIVDGVVQDGTLSGDINVTVNGDVNTLQNNIGDVRANSAGSIKTGSGDVFIDGDVSGSVQTGSGDVKCGDVGNSVKTGSGDVYKL